MNPKIYLFLVLTAIACLLLSVPAYAASQEEVNVAIDKGLTWLAAQQQANGSWLYFNNPPSQYALVDVATTGLVVLELEKRAKDLGVQHPLDPSYPYSENVRGGLEYLFGNAATDLHGIHFYRLGNYDVYNTSIVMMAIAMSNDPDRLVEAAGPLNGMNYRDVLQGMMNWMAFAQNTTGCEAGGWGYNESSAGWADNSNSGYATLGIGFAADFPPQGFGLTVPDGVLENLSTFVSHVQLLSGPYAGGSIYNPCWGPGSTWVNALKTGNLLAELGMLGKRLDDPNDLSVQNAVSFLENYWDAPACNFADGCGWRGDYQAMFAMAKGLDVMGIKSLMISGNEVNWFDEVSTYIVEAQYADGHWLSTSADEGISPTINTAWALLTLERIALGYVLNVPLYKQNPNPTSCDCTTGAGCNEWQCEKLGFGDLTIGGYGCALTSVVMVVRSYGITTIEEPSTGQQVDLTPLTLNNWMKAHHSFSCDEHGICDLMNWGAVQAFTGGRLILASQVDSLDDELLRKHRPVILREGSDSRTHFVVARGKLVTDDPSDSGTISPAHYKNVLIRDPFVFGDLFNPDNLGDSFGRLNYSPIRMHKVYTVGDCEGEVCLIPPRLTFNIHSPAEILVTDPYGRLAGYDSASGEVVLNIPGSTYEDEGGIADPENPGGPATEAFKSLDIGSPVDGTYIVKVIGTDTGPYLLEVRSQDSRIGDDEGVQEARGIINEEEEIEYSADYSTTDARALSLAVVNHPPVANAGSSNRVECQGDGEASVMLDGSGSSDADSTPGTNDDIISFVWSEGGTYLGSGVETSAALVLGSHDVTLTVTDKAGAIGTDDVNITVSDTAPPVITCPSSVQVECQSGGQAEVLLAAAVASDMCYGMVGVVNDRTSGGGDASGSYPLGSTRVAFTATDPSGNIGSCETTVTVVDTTPPVIQSNVSPSVLWPPNHRMVDVGVQVLATDTCTATTFLLASVLSSEPDDAQGSGDGNTVNDIQGSDIGIADTAFRLRAERDGEGEGRTYRITYTAVDGSGNQSSTSSIVFVPHDQGGSTEPLLISGDEYGSGTVLSWGPVPGALTYRGIRGNVGSLSDAGGFIDLGTVACIQPATGGMSTQGHEDAEDPPLGEAFFYLVAYNDGGDSGYGSDTATKPRVKRGGGCE